MARTCTAAVALPTSRKGSERRPTARRDPGRYGQRLQTPGSTPSLADDPTTTIVTGIPRSGTSLMMSILGAAGLPLLTDGARPPDVSNPRGYFEYAPVKASATDLAWLDAARGHAVKVIHALLPALPGDRIYRVVLMQRPLAEVVASQDRMLAAHGPPGDASAAGRLERIFAAQLDETRALLERAAHFDWVAIDYPALIAAPDGELERLRAFLSLPDRIAEMRACIDPALHRERSGPGSPTDRQAV